MEINTKSDILQLDKVPPHQLVTYSKDTSLTLQQADQQAASFNPRHQQGLLENHPQFSESTLALLMSQVLLV